MAHYTGDNLMTLHWLLEALVVPCDIGPDLHLNWVADTWKLRAVARSRVTDSWLISRPAPVEGSVQG